MALNKVYAVYGADIECNGLLKLFSNREDATIFIQKIISYNKTRPYTNDEMCEAISAGDDEFNIADSYLWAWQKEHPCDCADLYEDFFISEIEVH